MLRVCRVCKAPIYNKNDKFFCYHCKDYRKESQLFQDDFSQFITEYLQQTEFTGEDIDHLLMAVEYLTEILGILIERHGRMHLKVQRLENRLDWYRSVTTKLIE